MKEQFFYCALSEMIFYRNDSLAEHYYYAAWVVGSHNYGQSGYNWDTTPYHYDTDDKREFSEKYFILRGWECRPPNLE